MKYKVIMTITFTSALIILSSTYIFNNIDTKKNFIQDFSAKIVTNTNIDKNEIQQAKLNEYENVKQDFLIKKDTENIIRLIGVQGKFGITEPYFYENDFVSTILYLWGYEKDILNKQLKIVATNSNGESLIIPNLYKITKDGHGDVSDKNTISTATGYSRIQCGGNWNNIVDELMVKL